MPVDVCRHTPTVANKALYWSHVVWNHTPDFTPGDRVIRVCLLADWMDGLVDRCPSCVWDSLEPGDYIHLHHLPDGDDCCEGYDY